MGDGGSKLIVVSSLGDVNDRRTWSATPYNIVEALRRRGTAVETYNLGKSRLSYKLLSLLNGVQGYGRNEPLRVGLGRWIMRRQAQAIVARAEGASFLHFGSDHLPLRRLPGQRHYLFTDDIFSRLCHAEAYQTGNSAKMRDAVIAFERRMVDQLDGLFLTADYVADLYATTYDKPRAQLIRVGCGLGRSFDDPGEKDYRNGHMLFVARQNFVNKGGRLLLDAFDIVHRSRPDLRLVIIGNSRDKTQAADVPRMKSTPGIEFHEANSPDYARLNETAALYAGPAPNEAWGLIYLEAMSLRTPIAGLDRNAFPQFVDGGRNGFVARDVTPAAVAEMLLDAMSDPARLAQKGLAGREHVLQNYSWDKVAADIMARVESDKVAA